MGRYPTNSSAVLRREISGRNLDRAAGFASEATYGSVPSVLYCDADGRHGNFLDASYRAICANPDWLRRLGKSYSASRRVPRSMDRRRFELDCANSSDALLMNIFCYPRIMARTQLCALLGMELCSRPMFGVKPRIPLGNLRADHSEFDMQVGTTLVEAKLTETSFQTAPLRLVTRYRDLGEVFDEENLPARDGMVASYQLIRGVLAAHASGGSFLLLSDGRREDLVERWFEILRAVKLYELRSRLKLATWQEIAATVPKRLQQFLDAKYGIVPL